MVALVPALVPVALPVPYDRVRQVRVLTMTQPHASLVAGGVRDWHTFPDDTDYRGAVLIHAANAFEPWDRALITRWPYPKLLMECGYTIDVREGRLIEHLPRGAVLACALLRETRTAGWVRRQLAPTERSTGPLPRGHYTWFFDRIVPLPTPIPMRDRTFDDVNVEGILGARSLYRVE